ncbi:hypothetical protein MMC27_002254 [Xylographa pallens]|nr:hypothetical protein [Xylographa pallens]
MVAFNSLHGPLRKTSVLRPLLRAYLFAHVSSTGPRLLSLLFTLRSKRLNWRQALTAVHGILLSALDFNRFPSFCAALVGGYTTFQYLIQFLIHLISKRSSISLRLRGFSNTVSRFLAAFIAAWLSLRLLNNVKGPSRPDDRPSETKILDGQEGSRKDSIQLDRPVSQSKQPGLLGQSLDLTILVSVRALDSVVGDLWSRLASPRVLKSQRSSVYSRISQFTDAGVFAVSAGAVMWAWFYLPERLPREYNKWIDQAAQVDLRLVEVLRNARRGKFIYGKETGQAPILEGMCKDYGWPLVWGNPAQTIPIPCEMVHMGTGPSCHWHAVVRFIRAFRFSMAMYLPLQLLVKARHPSVKALKQALRDATRSSAFLGAFISTFYYSVCLSRTLLGPRIFSRKIISAMAIDSGICVGVGCMMCGWSILLEARKRRQEIAFFVAPRAVATFLPRRYESKYLWREQLAFSLSTAILFAYAQKNPTKIRGVLGQILDKVLN